MAERPVNAPASSIRTIAVTRCPVCGQAGDVAHRSITDRAYGTAGEWEILRCTHCHGGWLNPAPIPEDLAQCYVGGYYTHEAPPPPTLGSSAPLAFLRGSILSVEKGYHHLRPASALAPAAGRLGLLVPLFRRRASFNLDRLLVPFRQGGRLLEIGCGDGSYMALMRLLGWQVRGIEPDPAAAAQAIKASGCDVHIGTVEDAPFEPGSFDAIVSNHVIEHVYDPASFVSSAARLLGKGGLIAVRTPNFQSLGHRMFGPDWFSLDPPRHLCLFTPTSLRMLFGKSGLFSDVRISTRAAGSRLAIRRYHAVRGTGSFFGAVESGIVNRFSEYAFRAAEACGNGVFHWGEEITALAVRS